MPRHHGDSGPAVAPGAAAAASAAASAPAALASATASTSDTSAAVVTPWGSVCGDPTSEPDDWDLANDTDSDLEGIDAAGDGGLRCVTRTGSAGPGSRAQLTRARSGSAGYATGGGGSAGSGSGGGTTPTETMAHVFPPATLDALTALPLGEAWKLARARVTLDRSSRVDVCKLYFASIELIETIEAIERSSLSTRLLGIFLLYALYIDPSLPIPIDASENVFFKGSPFPVDDGLGLKHNSALFTLWRGLPPDPASSACVSRMTATQRQAVAVSRAHPFLPYFLHLADAGSNEERALAILLLVAPGSAIHAVQDPAFLSKSMVHLATASQGFAQLLQEPDAINADAELDILEDYHRRFEQGLREHSGYQSHQFIDFSSITWRRSMGKDEKACPGRHTALVDALSRASTAPLPGYKLDVCIPTVIPPRLLLPAMVQGLVHNNPEIAVHVLSNTVLDDTITEILLRPTNPLRLSQLQVLHKLWVKGKLAKMGHLPSFVSRIVSLALVSSSARTVSLTAKFLSKYVTELPEESLVEVRNFCSEHLRFKDVSDLFRLVSQVGTADKGATPPATAKPPPPPSTPSASSGNHAGGGAASGHRSLGARKRGSKRS